MEILNQPIKAFGSINDLLAEVINPQKSFFFSELATKWTKPKNQTKKKKKQTKAKQKTTSSQHPWRPE